LESRFRDRLFFCYILWPSIDLHVGKSIIWKKLKIFMAISVWLMPWSRPIR
jgi:hypothetical protein